jgi:hypothetical protein
MIRLSLVVLTLCSLRHCIHMPFILGSPSQVIVDTTKLFSLVKGSNTDDGETEMSLLDVRAC